MELSQRLSAVKKSIPPGVSLIVVSKTQSVENILQLYHCGQKSFGENKAQELVLKAKQLPNDIEWHFIGHLQSNKVKIILPYASLIHSIDSFKLLQIINNESLNINKITDCLLQIYIASEETKFGFDPEEVIQMLSSPEYKLLKNIRICGLMGMATFTSNKDQVRSEFKKLHSTFTKIKRLYYSDIEYFKEMSMGMSDDYAIGIEEGSTLVRIGTAIFGERKVI